MSGNPVPQFSMAPHANPRFLEEALKMLPDANPNLREEFLKMLPDAKHLPFPQRHPFPHVDWKETRDAHIFNLDIPGLTEKAVKVRVADDGVVEISGERRGEEVNAGEEEKYHRTDRFKGSFVRRFRVSEDAKLDEAKASMGHGVLTLIVPKKHDYQSNFKDLQISNSIS